MSVGAIDRHLHQAHGNPGPNPTPVITMMNATPRAASPAKSVALSCLESTAYSRNEVFVAPLGIGALLAGGRSEGTGSVAVRSWSVRRVVLAVGVVLVAASCAQGGDRVDRESLAAAQALWNEKRPDVYVVWYEGDVDGLDTDVATNARNRRSVR